MKNVNPVVKPLYFLPQHALVSILLSIFLILPYSFVYAFTWKDFWSTPDQQGAKLLQSGKADEAANKFQNKDWQAIANYRAGHYGEAFKHFNTIMNTSDHAYNAGNAAAWMGHYKEAIAAYDRAIALNSNNRDAVFNREIVKKLLQKEQQTEKKQKQEAQQKQQQSQQSQQSQQEKQQNGKSGQKPNQEQPEQQQSSSNNKENQKDTPAADGGKSTDQKSDKQQGENKKQEKPQQQSQQNSLAEKDNDQKNMDTQKTNPPPSKADKNEHADVAPNKQQSKSDTQVQNQSQQKNPSAEKGNNPTSASARQRPKNQNEEQKQLIRRLADDPGGLLRQKFLRDYMRRHATEENKAADGEN